MFTTYACISSNVLFIYRYKVKRDNEVAMYFASYFPFSFLQIFWISERKSMYGLQ